MRIAPVVLAGLLLTSPAVAQVTTNEGALDSLAAPHTTRPARPRPARPPSHPAVAAPPAPVAKPVKPPISATPPAILALPPAVAVPLAHLPPAPAVPIADDAPGSAAPIPNGLRVSFGPGRADFNPATAAALTQFAGGFTGSDVGIHVFAYATGSADDPSMPRRLSLERALAVRAALLKAGITSPRIYPRALGPAGGDQPDRVDVVTGTTIPPAAALPEAGRPG